MCQIYVITIIIPVVTIPLIREGTIRRNGKGDEFKYDIFGIL
jgi:hypothetical protein